MANIGSKVLTAIDSVQGDASFSLIPITMSRKKATIENYRIDS
jgi:hypothetical protein